MPFTNMNNKPINQSKAEVTETLQETINLRQHMPTTNKQKSLEVKELFQEIVRKLENSEIYFEGVKF
ncbi:6403_t:CDS:1 [Gigaspora margarita]|uniref:6403_t:CDS:1 n=1 Tax=Gigaspora margarita TaxID=4874 RepID=A0ABN7X452_GIGMA|nr:6403_t:CDS:1 [Gigaspora margarita]